MRFTVQRFTGSRFRGFAVLCLLSSVLCFTACRLSPTAQQGGKTTTTLGGTAGPTVVTSAAPENPQTPSTTTVEKTTTREFAPPPPKPTADNADNADKAAGSRASVSAPSVKSAVAPALVREIVLEKATTQTGAAQKDTARELGARLSNMRGVMWTGVALLVGGPIVGWKLGWFTNGAIAGAVGLLLIILSTVIPGNEAWFGLGGLLLIPVVAFVYYRARHDSVNPPEADKPATQSSP